MLMLALDTVSVAEATGLVPPGPLQVNEYLVVAPTAPVFWVPLAASDPLQPADAVQEPAWVELQVKVEEPPGAITDGYTESVTAGIASTATVVVAAGPVPPIPLQVSE
jgi:hypothetical protein